MKLIKLAIGDETAVQGTFTHTALLVGDALIYYVVRDPKQAPIRGAVVVPDAGDAAPPGVEVQWPVLAGVTATGRDVLVFRSGEQGPNGWTGKSILYAAVGAASEARDLNRSIVVYTTQPGPQGPKGDKGDRGPQGPAGPAGEGANVDDATIDRIAARVWTLPPSGDQVNLSGIDMGTAAQEVTAYAWSQRQDFLQLVIRRIDEAVNNLLEGGYKPKGS